MKKINKPTTKEKDTPMADSVVAMPPPIRAQSASPVIWPIHKSSWAQVVSTTKPVRCGTCDKDIKPLQTALFWDANKKYMSIAYLAFDDTLLGIKLVKFFNKPRSPICVACIVDE